MFAKLCHLTSNEEETSYFLGLMGYHDSWVYNFFQTTQYMSSLHPSLVNNVQEILKVKKWNWIFFFSFLAHMAKDQLRFCQHLASIVHRNLFKNYVWQPSTPNLIVLLIFVSLNELMIF